MKTLLTIILITINVCAFGQNTLEQYFYNKYYSDSVKNKDSIICEERGHLWIGISTTLAYCPDYIIDYPDSSVRVIPCCNQITYTCERCKKQKIGTCKEKRIIIWGK